MKTKTIHRQPPEGIGEIITRSSQRLDLALDLLIEYLLQSPQSPSTPPIAAHGHQPQNATSRDCALPAESQGYLSSSLPLWRRSRTASRSDRRRRLPPPDLSS